MPLSDYAHWNEEAPIIWWQEEGKHEGHHEDREPRDDGEITAAEAFAESCQDYTTHDIERILADDEYLERWPLAESILRAELIAREENDE